MTLSMGFRSLVSRLPAIQATRLLAFALGRDRIRARDTVRRRVTIAALSVAAWDPDFHHGPRFPEPPCNPGRSDFPIPVLTLAFPARPFQDQSGLSARPHTPQPMSVYRAARP